MPIWPAQQRIVSRHTLAASPTRPINIGMKVRSYFSQSEIIMATDFAQSSAAYRSNHIGHILETVASLLSRTARCCRSARCTWKTCFATSSPIVLSSSPLVLFVKRNPHTSTRFARIPYHQAISCKLKATNNSQVAAPGGGLCGLEDTNSVCCCPGIDRGDDPELLRKFLGGELEQINVHRALVVIVVPVDKERT